MNTENSKSRETRPRDVSFDKNTGIYHHDAETCPFFSFFKEFINIVME